MYDYSAGKHRNTNVSVRNGNVSGYDYSTRSHFSGDGSNGNLNFYDYETRSHVQLKLDGNRFSGYDYHTGRHFSGTVNRGSISLYDYDGGGYHSYSA